MHSRSHVEKLKSLIARAAHDGTPPAEARTCAVIACRMIVRLGIELGVTSTGVVDQRAPDVMTHARVADRCVACGGAIVVDERIWFELARGSTCSRCLRRAARAARKARAA